MATNVYIFLGLLAVSAIGFARIVSAIRSVKKSSGFLNLFRNRFIGMAGSYFSSGYAAARSVDPDDYHWLTLNCNRAQREVGRSGTGEFIVPLQGYKIRNYPFISSAMPRFADGNIRQNEVNAVDHILLKRIGDLQETGERLEHRLRNPFRWFQYGIRFLLGFPVRLLNWFGIIDSGSLDRFNSNWLFKLVAGIVGLAAFLSSLVTIVAGWGTLEKSVRAILKYLP